MFSRWLKYQSGRCHAQLSNVPAAVLSRTLALHVIQLGATSIRAAVGSQVAVCMQAENRLASLRIARHLVMDLGVAMTVPCVEDAW